MVATGRRLAQIPRSETNRAAPGKGWHRSSMHETHGEEWLGCRPSPDPGGKVYMEVAQGLPD